MRVWGPAALALASAGLFGELGIAAASAQVLPANMALQGNLSVSGGYTDNVASSPTTPLAGMVPPQADDFVEIRPGLALSLTERRSVHRLSYSFFGNIYRDHAEANSYSHQGEWNGFFQVSPTGELHLTTAATYGRLNTFNLLAASSQVPIGAMPTGSVLYISPRLLEVFAWDMTPRWRGTETLELVNFMPLDEHTAQATTYDLETHFLADRRLGRKDSLGLDTRIGYVLYGEVDDPTMPMRIATPQRQQILHALSLRYRHDFDRYWSGEADAGGIVVVRANDFGQAVVEPTGLLALRYTHDRGQGEISYAHAVQPNVLVGQTFGLDELQVHGSLPIGRETHLAVSGSAGVEYGRVLDTGNGATLGSATIWLADASMSWAPMPEFSLFVRYQLYDQISRSGTALPTMERALVLAGVTGVLGEGQAMPVPTRPAQRVDGADRATIWPTQPREDEPMRPTDGRSPEPIGPMQSNEAHPPPPPQK